jgi:hypothetical protein
MQKSRWLFQTLILSVALNAALLCTFFYFLIRDNPVQFSYQPKEEVKCEMAPLSFAFLERLNTFSFKQLIEMLNDERKVEQGYQVRDFALGAMVTFHEFDVERGLGKNGLSKRKWEFKEKGGEGSLFLFPGLEDQDFEILKAFVAKERFPFTPKGLFRQIRKEGMQKSDRDLLAFFCHTPPFILLETLFARTQLPIQKKTILALALEGGWEPLETFYKNQQDASDFSEKIRTDYLIKAIEKDSKTAAYLLVITDLNYAVKHLDDQIVGKVLDLLTDKTKEAIQFAQVVAVSPRGDRLREKAAKRLVEYKVENNEEDLAGHFIEKPGLKHLRPVFREQPPAAPPPTIHIVQPGETLWQIAQKYGIPIEALMERNHLQTTAIQVGKTLKVF